MRTALRYFLVLSLIQFCFSASVIAQITADFNADVNSGCAPLEVHFTNLSSAGPGYVYRWDLGDGTISMQSIRRLSISKRVSMLCHLP